MVRRCADVLFECLVVEEHEVLQKSELSIESFRIGIDCPHQQRILQPAVERVQRSEKRHLGGTCI